jgi:undecaprenyl-diphosphatase
MLLRALQAVILGLLQGATEFIPVSSSAHLIIVPWLFGWRDPALTSLPFDVALHLGTLLAVLAFFARDWLRLIRAWLLSVAQRRIGTDPDRRLAWFVVLGTIPGGIVGMLAESKVEALFHRAGVPVSSAAMLLMALIIAALGLALLLAEKLALRQRGLAQLTLKDALSIGLAQALAVFPGISRAGSTITAGLALGLEREAAARFSFLLSAPIIAGAGVKSLWEVFKGWRAGSIAGGDLALFPIGVLAAALSGYLCIGFLLRYLQRRTVAVFVYYRWALAVLLVLVALLRG